MKTNKHKKLDPKAKDKDKFDFDRVEYLEDLTAKDFVHPGLFVSFCFSYVCLFFHSCLFMFVFLFPLLVCFFLD